MARSRAYGLTVQCVCGRRVGWNGSRLAQHRRLGIDRPWSWCTSRTPARTSLCYCNSHGHKRSEHPVTGCIVDACSCPKEPA